MLYFPDEGFYSLISLLIQEEPLSIPQKVWLHKIKMFAKSRGAITSRQFEVLEDIALSRDMSFVGSVTKSSDDFRRFGHGLV